MGVGASVTVVGWGANLTFVVDDLGWPAVAVVGWMLMLAGSIGLAVVMSFRGRRRRDASKGTPRGVGKRRYDPRTPPV